MLIASVALYIWLGKKLRAAGQEEMLKQKAAERLKAEAQAEINVQQEETPNITTEKVIASEVVPISEEDLTKIKGIFGIDTFFATETISYQDGAIFKGNLRKEAEQAHSILTEKLQTQLGEKYRLFLVESPEEKPVVVILPSTNDPQTTTLAQKI